MMQPRQAYPGFRLLFMPKGVTVAHSRKRITHVVSIAVGRRGPACLIDIAFKIGKDVIRVIAAEMNLFLDHLMMRLQLPHAVLIPTGQARPRTTRQFHVEPVKPLLIVKLQHSNVQALVGTKAIPDPHLGQQPFNEGQVTLAVLHHLQPPRVLVQQVEQKMLPQITMAATQNAFDDFRHRLLLINTVLTTAPQ